MAASRNVFALKELSRSLQEQDLSSSSSSAHGGNIGSSSNSSRLPRSHVDDYDATGAAAAAAAAYNDGVFDFDPTGITQQQHAEWYNDQTLQSSSSYVNSSSHTEAFKQERIAEQGDEENEENEENDVPAEAPDSKKRKRNKPTLSCKECVEKKVKCDRGRPHCLSCIRRGTACVYKVKAEAPEDNLRQPSNRRVYPPRTSRQHQGSNDNSGSPTSSTGSRPALFTHQESTDLLLSSQPHTETGVRTIFGIGSEYPFSNYWTQNGGVSEVIDFLPSKEQSDILVNVFFEAVDPVYPLLSRERFYIDYNGFWELDEPKRLEVDTDFLALLFMVYAMGTQFLQGPGSEEELHNAADFFSSAYYQSLRLFSYLNRTSVRCLQSMVLMTYFLLNSGRASDGWAFSGTLIRQAYAFGMNREPTLISPQFTTFQRLERRRLWHGIVCQDSFMSMSLRLPPGATHSDIDNAAPMLENDSSFYTETSSVEAAAGNEDSSNKSFKSDTGFVQSMYALALLTQETISIPRSLSMPVAANIRQRNMLMSRFRSCYRSFPDAFRAWDETSVTTMAQEGNKRLVRQILFLTGLYWYCVTLVQTDGMEELTFTPEDSRIMGLIPSNIEAWIRGALDAVSETMRAFFVIHAVLGGESSIWWSFCHRAFSASIIVADLLKRRDIAVGLRANPDADPSTIPSFSEPRDTTLDPLWERARVDVHRMLNLHKARAAAGDEAAKTRVEVLSNYL